MDIYILHGPIQVAVRYVLWSVLKVNYWICVLGKFVIGFWDSIICAWIIRKIKPLRLLFFGEKIWGKKETKSETELIADKEKKDKAPEE